MTHSQLEDFLSAFLCVRYLAAHAFLAEQVCPSGSCSRLELAYYQWSEGAITSLQGRASIAQDGDAIVGFPK